MWCIINTDENRCYWYDTRKVRNVSSDKKFVAYYRVSTERQGRSGLGLEAQRQAVADLLNGNGGRELVAEFTEVESGKSSARPELEKAIATANLHSARLIVAKLDRLARDAAFLLSLRDTGVDFVAADMPDANRLTVGILAVVAEEERRAISERTKAALAAARARGTELGGHPERLSTQDRQKGGRISGEVRSARADRRATHLAPILDEIQTEGATSLREIAASLDERGIPTARGSTWTASAVKRVLDRLEQLEAK